MNDKILIIGPSWVGDMIMAQTLFKIIKQQKPDSQIDVLAPAWSLPILERMPEINEKILLSAKHGEFALQQRWQLGMSLRKHKYTRAIVLTNSWKSALVPFFAKIPIRSGWLGECRWLLLNDIRYLDKKKLPRMVDRYASLAFARNEPLPTSLPTPRLQAYPADEPTKPVLALCPGAAYGPAKRWPEEYFATLAAEKLSEGWDIWFFGSKQDEPVIENIRQSLDAPTTSYAGKIDLMQTIDLFSTVSSVVSNDSGLMHLAAALDKPVVAIYGSTSPIFTPPLGLKAKVVQNKVSCSPCFKRTCPLEHFACMREVTPNKVSKALEELEIN